MKEYSKTTKGVAVEHNGKYWGIIYEDGHGTSHGWGEIDKARISNPEYCEKPTDMTNKNSPNVRELQKGRLVKVKKTTIFEVEIG